MSHPYNRLALSAPGQLVPPARRPYLVVNPRSRLASSAIAEVVRQCRQAGLETPQLLATTPQEAGASQARTAVAAGADLVIAIGGDGTVRQVAQELADTGTRLAVVARGSGNVLAHNLGLGRLDVGGQIAVALGVHYGELDLGWAQLTDPDGKVAIEPFLTMAGIGRDARAVASTTLAAKYRLGALAYGLAGLGQALRPGLPMTVQLDDQPPHSVRTWTVLAGITPLAPGGVTISPDAVADDGLLDVLEVPIASPLQWLPVAAKGLFWPSRRVSALRYARAERLRVRPAEPQPVQLDGDVFTQIVQLEASLQTRSLRVQVPDPDEGNPA